MIQMVATAKSQPAAADTTTARAEEAMKDDHAGMEFTARRDQAGYLADIEVRHSLKNCPNIANRGCSISPACWL